MPLKLGRCVDKRVKRGCCPEAMDFFGSIGKKGCGRGKKTPDEFPVTLPTCVSPCRNPKPEEDKCLGIAKRMAKQGCGCMQGKKRPANMPNPKGMEAFPICQEPKYKPLIEEKDSDSYCVVECDKDHQHKYPQQQQQLQQILNCCQQDMMSQQQYQPQQQFQPMQDSCFQQQQYSCQSPQQSYNTQQCPPTLRTAVVMLPCDHCCFPMILIVSPT